MFFDLEFLSLESYKLKKISETLAGWGEELRKKLSFDWILLQKERVYLNNKDIWYLAKLYLFATDW